MLGCFILMGLFFGAPLSLAQDIMEIQENNNNTLINTLLSQMTSDSENDTIHIPMDLEEEARVIIQDMLSETKLDETSRSAHADDLTELSRERLLELLQKAEKLEGTLPSNRERLIKDKVIEDKRGDSDDDNDEDENDGIKCIQRVIMVEDTEYERRMQCHHTLQDKCHMTYITNFVSAPEKKCETTFKKNCHISFKSVPKTESFDKCHIPLVKRCGEEIEGPEICKTEYEDNCETTYKEYQLEQEVPKCETKEELRCQNKTVNFLNLPFNAEEGLIDENFITKEVCEKWPVKKCSIEKEKVTKVHPETECRKIPKEVCAPSSCVTLPGEKICHQETRTIVHNVPEEECDLEPQKVCRTESTLVPRLIPTKNCVKVPKDVCVNIKTNPRKVKKPVIKNWCYDPNDESLLG